MISIEQLSGRLQEAQGEIIKQNQIVGDISSILDNQWILYKAAGLGDIFIDGLVEAVTQSSLPSLLTTERPTVINRRQPSFREAVIETAKRLKLINQLDQDVPDEIMAIVLGGSMSYGRFYNIRGGVDSSDIDLFFIVDQDFFQKTDVLKILPPALGFKPEDLDHLQERINIVPFLQDRADIMSHKLELEDFIVSVKFFPFDVFVDEFIEGPENAMILGRNVECSIRDNKQEPYSMKVFTQYNFLHEPLYYTISEIACQEGVITSIPAFIIKDGHFYTGDHHNQVLPFFDLIFDRSGSVSDILRQNHELLKIRCNQEQEQSKNPSDLLVINAQARKPVFSPQILKKAVGEFE